MTVVRTAAYLPRRLGDSQDEWTLPLGSLPRRLALPHPSVVARPEAEAVQAALGATIRAVATELLHESGAAAADDDADAGADGEAAAGQQGGGASRGACASRMAGWLVQLLGQEQAHDLP